MKTKDLKNSVLDELNLLAEMAMEDVKNDTGFEWIDEAVKNCSTGKKQAEKKDEIIEYKYRHFYRDETNENIYSLEYDGQSMLFPINRVNQIAYSVKNQWPDGKEPTHKDWNKKSLDKRGIDLQQKIYVWRYAYKNGSKELTYDEKNNGCGYRSCSELFCEHVIEMYEKSKPGDLIRLCWKFITDSLELEGVHFAWIDPKVTVKCIEDSPEHLAFKNKLFAEIIEVKKDNRNSSTVLNKYFNPFKNIWVEVA